MNPVIDVHGLRNTYGTVVAPDAILNQTVEAVVANWRHEFGPDQA